MKFDRIALYYAASALPLGALVVCAAAAPPAAKTAPADDPAFARDVLPVVQKYCLNCHKGDMPAAGVSLSEYRTGAAALQARNLWEKVESNVSSKHMPPAGMPQPTPEERDKVAGWIQSALTRADCNLKEPGRVTLRRLNRAEYNNTVRDLLGVDIRPADEFPSDDVGYGFDNIGDVLSLSPLLMEKYLTAARKVARAAIVAPEDRVARPMTFPASRFTGDGDVYGESGGHILLSEGETGVDYDFPGPGDYVLRAAAFEQHAGPDVAKMAFRVGGKEVKSFDVRAQQTTPGVYETHVAIEKPGRQRVTLAFLNDYYDVQSADPKLRGDRNLIFQRLEIVPFDVQVAPTLPASQRRLITAYPKDKSEVARDAATRQVMAAFARRAYRRPVAKDDVERLVRIAALGRRGGGSYERGIQTAVQAALVSPNFLFQVERDPSATAATKRPLNDYELATRLSYFLWSSMPDERLFSLAAQGALHKPQILVAEARRMLKDPKAGALSDNFAGQWLQLRKLNVVTPDPKKFPGFTETLRGAMRTETEMFFRSVVAEDRSVLDFLDADYTFLNGTLAKHYGIEDVQGDSFRRVALHSKQRGGLLAQASVLTVTSNPTRTSPVKRGKWVLDNILGTPPPPPPPGVAQLPDDKKAPLVGTLRQRMEQHRNNPTCASCHQRMDPIGFGLENYDAVGVWRTMDGSDKIDATGQLPDGSTFDGPTGLKSYLMNKKGQFVRSLTERVMTYALGRGLEPYDRCNVDALAQRVAKNDYKFSAIVAAVVTSEPFLYRGADHATPNGKKEVAQR